MLDRNEIISEDLAAGLLEYDTDRFAYVHANGSFMREFEPIENLNSVSKVFREHLDTRNYNTLLQAFKVCSVKKKDTFCALKWRCDDGRIKTYHGYVKYHGNIEAHSNLEVTFIDVTETETVGSRDEHSNVRAALEVLYLCNFYINLNDYSFKAYKVQPYMKELIDSCKSAIDAVREYIKCMLEEDGKEAMRAFLDMTTLKQRMQDTNVLEHIYNDPHIGWVKAIFTVVERDPNGDTESVALVVEAISKKKDMSIVDAKMKRSLEKESKLWNSVKHLVAASELKETTNTIIKEVMDYYAADRAYIFDFDWNNNVASNTYEVCAPDVEPVIDTLQNISLEFMGVWVDLFNEKSLILIKDLDDLIGDESRKIEYEMLEPQGIKSLIAAPVYFEETLVGFLGVDNPKRNLDDKAFIKNLAFFCVNVSSREKERKVLEEMSMRDALTGAYNRRGYDEILKEHESDSRPMAYVQLDIDNFKGLNDTYGHNFGDEVLKQVVVQLKNAFRADDYVFRFGGDEFAVLLTNCNIDAWNSISEKQRLIHIRLNQILKRGMYVTLSMGISWSASGFKEELVTLADAALYKAKANGRCGLCVFDTSNKAIFEWRDDIADDIKDQKLYESNIGACRIELPAGDLSRGRMICNETARHLMGFDVSMLPEEAFRTWLSRIDSYSKDAIKKTRQAMIEKGQAECTYIYRHPIQGQIMVRSGGRCLNNEDGLVFYGYHQSLKGTQIILEEDDSQKLIEAMMSLYFASYYISLQDDCFWIFKSTAESKHLDKQDTPASVNIHKFVDSLVKPQYREEMNRFVNLKTLPERLKDRDFVETEYESMVADKGWCRVRLLAVKRDEDGQVTHAQMLFASIDKNKNK